MNRNHPGRGFTLIEVMLSVAVVAVLAAIALMSYRSYIDRARSAEIITRYDAIRTGVNGRLPTSPVEDCDELAKRFETNNLPNQHATLAYSFRAVKGGPGYRPVLNVCAQVGSHGVEGVSVAREVHDTLAKNGVVDDRPVLLGTMANFALRLTEGELAYCSKPPTAVRLCDQGTQAGGGPSTVVVQTPPVQTPPVQTPPGQNPPVQNPPVQNPPVQNPPVQNPPVQTGSQPGKPTVQPPATQQPQSTVGQKPPVASTGTSILRPNGSVDIAALAAVVKPMPSMHLLSDAEKGTVAYVAATMAVNGFYANSVLAALRAAGGRGSVAKVPDPKSQAGSGVTIDFDFEMRQALDLAHADALEQVCLARRGPTASCR